MKLTQYRIKEQRMPGRAYFLQFQDTWKLFWFIDTRIKVWRYIPDSFKLNRFRKFECPTTVTGSMFDLSRVSYSDVIGVHRYKSILKEFVKENPFIEMYLSSLKKKAKYEKEKKVEYL